MFPRSSSALLLACCLGTVGCSDRTPASRTSAPPSLADASGPRAIGELAQRASPGPPILFIGLDGADWNQLDPLLARGALPHLARLRAASAWGALESETPALSPLLWTSMLTGLSPVEHGILDFSRFAPGSGLREPIGSEDRRAPAIWNALTWAGKRVGLLGLWATHPAEPVNGIVVSDRLFGFLNVEAEPPPGAIFPESRAAWARTRLAAAEAATDFASVKAYLPWLAEAQFREHSAAARAYDHPVSALRRILVETRLYGAMAESLLAESPALDLTLVYLQGTDSIGHVFAPFAPPRQPTVSQDDFRRYSEVPERYFREVDALLGRLLALADRRGGNVVVASDHGFLWNEGRPDRWASSDTRTAARWHRSQGIWLVRAPGLAPGRAADGRLRQLFPTLLALAGLPAATGAEAQPLGALAPPATPAFDYARVYRELAARRPPDRSRDRLAERVAERAAERASAEPSDAAEPFDTAEPSDAAEPSDTAEPSDAAEAIAKLQALGYIGAGEATRASPSALAAGGPDATRTASSWNNEGIVLRGERRDAEARAAFERAVELEPDLASALWNLSDLLLASGEAERSDDLLVRAVANGLPDGSRLVIGRAIARERAGALEQSLTLLDQALAVAPEAAELWLYRGRYRVQNGDCGNAVVDLARAAELAPGESDVFATAALAHLCAGDRSGAITALRRALDLAPNEPRLLALLAELQSVD